MFLPLRTAATALLLLAPAARAAPSLLRFPAVSRDMIAFVARDALWTAPIGGGTATRIAGGPGQGRVLLPRFSPDGRWIAYTLVHGPYADVELIAASGGTPRRLTFTSVEGPERGAPDNLVTGWTPDGRDILFLSRRWAASGWTERPALVARDGGLPEALPLDHAGFAALAPDGRSLVASTVLRDFQPWRRYAGGQREDLEVLDRARGLVRTLPGGRGNDMQPMWVGRSIVFLSDRSPDRSLQLWTIDPDGAGARALTHLGGGVQFPSAGAGVIVFEQSGRLWRMPASGGIPAAIPIELPDDGTAPRPHVVAIGSAVRVLAGGQYPSVRPDPDFALSPDGATAAFSARGDIVVAAQSGGTADLTQNGGTADDDHPAFSPDGRMLAYTTDRTGEDELAVRPAAGGPERIVTHVAHGVLYTPVFSPDGHTLAVPDSSHNLWLVTLGDNAAAITVAQDPAREIRDPAFSPDGKLLAWSTHDPNGLPVLHLRVLATGRETVVPTPLAGGEMPAFAADGTLLFVEDRQGIPVVSGSDRDLAFVDPDVIDRATLGPDGSVRAVTTLPVAPTAIAGLAVRGGLAFYEIAPPPTLGGPLPGQGGALHAFDLSTGHDATVLASPAAFVVSADGRHVLARTRQGFVLVDVSADRAPGAAVPMALGALRATVDPRAEWREMFEAAWRLERDALIDRSTGGVDWAAQRRRFEALLPLLGSRDDLNAILTRMLGELGSSHIVVAGGDEGPQPVIPEARLLGADLARDPSTGAVRIVHVLAGDPSQPNVQSPLAAVGVQDGETLRAIAGHEIEPSDSPDALLAAIPQGPVALGIAPADGRAERTVSIEPLADEMPLRWTDVVARRRQTVERLGSGRVGYVVVPDMGEAGAEQFARQFFPQRDREGLVIDVRENRGGYLSPFLIAQLTRAVEGRFINREGGAETLPPAAFASASVALADENSASDAEIFAWLFRTRHVGPLVGSRTLGGVRGFAGLWHLRDGGGVSVPFSRLVDREGRTMIEGHGVDPDIKVAAPALAGAPDVQLTAAIHAVSVVPRRRDGSREIPLAATPYKEDQRPRQ